MKKFPMLDTLLKLFIALTVGLLEKICILIYLLLPMGLFMLLMSLRTKNHKATAISTFANDHSEFQHIFPNYILVVVEPQLLKKEVMKKINAVNIFLQRYWGLLLTLLFFIFIFVILLVVCYLHIL